MVSMATFHFDLVSPEKLLFSGEVEQVDVPGSEGDFGVLAGHAPLVAMLRPGILTVMHGGEQTMRVVVIGGFAEVGPDGLTVLADLPTPVEDLDRAVLAGADQGDRGATSRTTQQGSRSTARSRGSTSSSSSTASAGTALH